MRVVIDHPCGLNLIGNQRKSPGPITQTYPLLPRHERLYQLLTRLQFRESQGANKEYPISAGADLTGQRRSLAGFVSRCQAQALAARSSVGSLPHFCTHGPCGKTSSQIQRHQGLRIFSLKIGHAICYTGLRTQYESDVGEAAPARGSVSRRARCRRRDSPNPPAATGLLDVIGHWCRSVDLTTNCVFASGRMVGCTVRRVPSAARSTEWKLSIRKSGPVQHPLSRRGRASVASTPRKWPRAKEFGSGAGT